MESEQAINIAVACVMASAVDDETKKKSDRKLRLLEEDK